MSSIIDDLEVSADAFTEETDDKKKMIKRLVHAILSYHVLPTGLDGRGLGQQSTHATMLKAHDGSIGGSARRISVIPPIFNRVGGVVNLYAKIKRLNIRASNGQLNDTVTNTLFHASSRCDPRGQLPLDTAALGTRVDIFGPECILRLGE